MKRTDLQEYAPFGPEWRAEVMKTRKEDIVEMFRKACIKLSDGGNDGTGEPAVRSGTSLPSPFDLKKSAAAPGSALEEWSVKAHAALKGAEVLAICLANANARIADLEQNGTLTTAELETIRQGFLGNNDNVLAIIDALAEWTNVAGDGRCEKTPPSQ